MVGKFVVAGLRCAVVLLAELSVHLWVRASFMLMSEQSDRQVILWELGACCPQVLSDSVGAAKFVSTVGELDVGSWQYHCLVARWFETVGLGS